MREVVGKRSLNCTIVFRIPLNENRMIANLTPEDTQRQFSTHRAVKIPLPTLPTIAVRLIELFDDPDVELPELAALLRSDPAIASKILRAANSPAYGVGRKVTDLQPAIALLGKMVVTSLALSFTLAERSMQRGSAAQLFQSYWLQAITQATAAECLAQRFFRQQSGEWFITGLLASVGRLSLINHDPEQYAELSTRAAACQIPLHELESSHFGMTTNELSIALLSEWKFPERCIDAVANQNCFLEQFGRGSAGVGKQLSAAIATSKAISDYFCQSRQGESLVQIVELMEGVFATGEDETVRLLETVRNRVDATSDLFQVDCTSLGTPSELMSLAMQHLSSLALDRPLTEPVGGSLACLVSQNKQLLDRVHRLTMRCMTDSLTGLFNRGYFEESLQQLVERASSSDLNIGVILIDIDFFKRINDTLGHLAGDDILREVAIVIRENVRTSDIVARYGGEEFVVLVPQADESVITRLSERIRGAVGTSVFGVDGRRVSVTISVGAAACRPLGADERFGRMLVAAADEQLYKSKSQGRDQVCVAAEFSSSYAAAQS